MPLISGPLLPVLLRGGCKEGWDMEPVSVIVLSGFFGAGKTAVLNRLIRTRGERRIAVIMNDLGGMGHDFRQIDDEEGFQGEEAWVGLESGCTGYSLRGQLIEAVSRLARERRFDTILIECSGRTDPLLVTELFEEEDAEGRPLSSLVRLDYLVTVVDAARFREDFESGDNLRERGTGIGIDDQRTVSELLADQVECSTTLVLNKTDLVTATARHRLEAFLRSLNPDAALLPTVHGEISIEQLGRATGVESDDHALSPGWMQLLEGRVSPVEGQRDIQSFVYRARLPFHPARFWTLMQDVWPGVLRSKGYFWIASQPSTCYMWSQAGGACLYERLGRWWVAISDRRWPRQKEALLELEKVWDLEFGDRRIELAFIGEELDHKGMTKRLNACLLTRAELALEEEIWRAFQDPFKKPSWEKRRDRTISGESFR